MVRFPVGIVWKLGTCQICDEDCKSDEYYHQECVENHFRKLKDKLIGQPNSSKRSD